MSAKKAKNNYTYQKEYVLFEGLLFFSLHKISSRLAGFTWWIQKFQGFSLDFENFAYGWVSIRERLL